MKMNKSLKSHLEGCHFSNLESVLVSYLYLFYQIFGYIYAQCVFT